MIVFLIKAIIGLYAIMKIFTWLFNKASTRYGKAKMLRHHPILKKSNKGLVIDGTRRLTVADSMRHVNVISPTGAQKSQRFTLNNISQIDSGSMVIIDPKQEAYTLLSGYLQEKGFVVQTIDLSDMSKSLRFNPMELSVKDDASADLFARTLYEMSNKNSTTEGIWKFGAITCLSVLIQFLLGLDDTRYLNMANLIHLLQGIVPNDMNCMTRQIIIAHGTNRDIEAFDSWFRNEEKIVGGQHSGAVAAVHHFTSREAKWLTAVNEIDFQSLRKTKTALFLITPMGRSEAFQSILSLFFSTMFDQLMSVPPDQMGRQDASLEKRHDVSFEHTEEGVPESTDQIDSETSTSQTEKVTAFTQKQQIRRHKWQSRFRRIAYITKALFFGLVRWIWKHIRQKFSREPLPKPHYPVFVIMEEFGVLQRIFSFGQVMSLARQYQISISIILQSSSQLNKYGESKNTILDNIFCTILYGGITDTDTLSRIGRLIGTGTNTERTEAGNIIVNAKKPLDAYDMRVQEKNKCVVLINNLPILLLKCIPFFEQGWLLYKAKIRSKKNRLVAQIPPPQRKSRAIGEVELIRMKDTPIQMKPLHNPRTINGTDIPSIMGTDGSIIGTNPFASSHKEEV